ncbi:MAG: hypothetical protein ACR2LI_15085 [Propionibacteriaceae bacterium]
MRCLLLHLIGAWTLLRAPDRDERGLSQSTENAILLAGAVVIAGVVITIVTGFVRGRLGGLG